MQLTGKQIVTNNIITNYCEEGIQQQGLDVRVDEIYEVYGCGSVPANGKTTPNPTRMLRPLTTGDTQTYVLSPGYYEVKLMEACKIPSNCALHYQTRSSLVRCGAIVHSGQFDAGFETEAMGCFLQVNKLIHIDKGARIAQAIVTESYPVDKEDLYDGQWQNDKQRAE